MLRSLFARLTGEPRRGQAIFERVVAEARQPHWFVQGEVPDTVNGRFAVLATISALNMVRLETEGADGGRASVALTERLVESLDAEVREMGVGDPTLGKQVRKLLGAVSARVDRWRPLLESNDDWTEEIQRSIYLSEPAKSDAVEHSEDELRRLWSGLSDASLEQLVGGRLE